MRFQLNVRVERQLHALCVIVRCAYIFVADILHLFDSNQNTHIRIKSVKIELFVQNRIKQKKKKRETKQNTDAWISCIFIVLKS